MTDDGGPAFPRQGVLCVSTEKGVDVKQQMGMSLRDWFAGQALAGLLANTQVNTDPRGYASDAMLYADAMIAERKQGAGK